MNSRVAKVLAIELIRAVRGRRSQSAFSRALGYRSNIARRWEAGACFPTASALLTACARLKPGTRQLFEAFLTRTPDWHDARRPFARQNIAAFLRELRGKTPIGVLVERTGYNRFQIGRWLRDQAEPKLPEFLCLVEAASRRTLDLLAGMVDLTQLPSVAEEWQRLCRARDAAYATPLSHAVLRALELRAYAAVPAAQGPAWLAQQLGVGQELVEQGLEVLIQSGQVQKTRGRFRSHRVLSVDTSQDQVRARQLRAYWAQLAVDRLRGGDPGWYGYTLFSIARADLPRLRALQLDYVRAMQSLIASSEPGELVGLYCAQLLDLGAQGSSRVPKRPR